jgi:uncharacterized membrane protein YcaP (DUF421 family)
MANVIFRTLVLFFALFCMLRLMGKRQIAQLQPYEFALMLITSNLITVPMADLDTPAAWGIVPILVLLTVGLALSLISMRSGFFRRMICSKPRLLIDRGVIDVEALSAVRYTVNDLLEQLRAKNVFDVTKVYSAVLETNGAISVLLKTDYDFATPRDLNLSPAQEQLNVTFISDGKVLRHNLRYSGKSEPWLYKRINDVKSVLVALYDGSRLFVQYKNGKSEVLK